ncbi:MAG TPA: L,D-transpeptidase family protein [Coriobacteriia bacterium]
MAQSGRGVRALAVAMALALTTFSLGVSSAVAGDYAQRTVLPRGAVIGGVDVGGLRREEAAALLKTRLEAPLMRPLAAEGRGKRFELDPARLVSIDVEGMVDRALAPRERTTLLERVYRRATDAAPGIAMPAEVKLDADGLRAWVARTAKGVYQRPTDSKLSVNGDGLAISKSEAGWRLDENAASVMLRKALTSAERELDLPVLPVKPRVTESSFGRTILVRLGERRLYLLDGTRRVKDYPIAVGMPEFPTPQGWWHIADKQVDPIWTNPHSGWSAAMPDFIPGGPGNPLGTRALLLDAPGVAIHGTSNDGSIGTAASHACMRMHMWDVEDLYPRVETGDRVIIAP